MAVFLASVLRAIDLAGSVILPGTGIMFDPPYVCVQDHGEACMYGHPQRP